ncbi:MAG: hypoxanthine phosphoribosyltransferase [Chitinophagales bacterium]|nr:hypoxanthine phosphoribosyltransferase [Chitinophagaceae bacterium]MCB9065261.1 hypoxanthine phosphoribosyltransferase [Chitinophagales bacterium]
MEQHVTVHDKRFEIFLHRNKIWERVCELGKQIEEDYKGKNPLFVGVLNGSFIFAADLFHAIDIPAEISFIKLSSYQGTESTGSVLTVIGLKEDVNDRHVLVVEDIIDTGKTLSELLPIINAQHPASLKVVSLLSKPDARTHDVPIDYIGFEIPDKFVVGYGLDYDGAGRNLTHIYSVVDDQ